MDVHGGTGAPCRVHRHCAFSSIEHSSRRCDPQLAIIFGRVSAGPEETHEGRQACIHTYEHPYEGCARKEGKKESKTSYCEFTSTASFPLPRRRASGCIFYRRSSDLIVMLLHLFYHFFNFWSWELIRKERKTESKTSYCEFTSTASFPLPRRRASGCIFYRRSSDLIVMLLHLFYLFFTFDRGSSFKRRILFIH